MVATYVTQLERLVSKARLDKYRPATGDDLETIVKYLWNVALSEALLQGLSALEVGLRNSVHNTMTSYVGTDYWFQAVLRPNEMKMVNDTWTKLFKRHEEPPSPGRIVAEMMFGFWPPLLSADYQKLWWSNSAALFKQTFPYIPTGLPPYQAITRKDVHERVEACHKLRNRVMHHEPVFHGLTLLNKPVMPLPTVHQYILDVLSWIDPNLVLNLSFVDRFPDVYQSEEQRIRVKIKAQFGIP